jgi:uncharacterized SAM-binding protein YcdF (DUF218 family)
MKRRLWLKVLGGLVILIILLSLAAWFFPQQVLTVDSGPVKADVLIVPGGTPDRAMRAAELFKAGEAPRIICSGLGDAEVNAAYLTNSGVPITAIILESKSRTTRENAEFSIATLRQMGAHRVIIVTSWYHSRRAVACFEHYAPDIKFYSRPAYFGYPGKQLAGESSPHPTLSPVEAERVRAGQRAERKAQEGYMKAEYVKLLGYWVCYGVCPL